MTLALLAIQAAALAGAAPAMHGDWLVVCDYQAKCSALSQVPAGSDAASHPLAVLRRDGAAIALDLPIAASIASGTRLTVAIDGQTIAQVVAPGGGAGLSLPFVGALARSIRRGRLLTIGGGAKRARMSLRGMREAAAAVANAVSPAATAAPAIETPAADPRAPRLPSRKMLAAAGDKRCRGIVTRAERLDAAHSLITIDGPCTGVRLHVLPDKGDLIPAVFDGGMPAGGAWDPVQRRYAQLLPPDSSAGCGTRQAHAWDGTRFRLVEERFIAECRRATYEVVTYRAIVRER